VEDIDPIKAWKFVVEIDGHMIGVMKVEGLTSKGPGWLSLTRGFVVETPMLRDWGNDIKNPGAAKKTIKVVVDGRLTFEFQECEPLSLTYGDLDAGSSGILTETLGVMFERVSVLEVVRDEEI